MELSVSDVREHKLDLTTTWRNLHNPTSPCKFAAIAVSEWWMFEVINRMCESGVDADEIYP